MLEGIEWLDKLEVTGSILPSVPVLSLLSEKTSGFFIHSLLCSRFALPR